MNITTINEHLNIMVVKLVMQSQKLTAIQKLMMALFCMVTAHSLTLFNEVSGVSHLGIYSAASISSS